MRRLLLPLLIAASLMFSACARPAPPTARPPATATAALIPTSTPAALPTVTAACISSQPTDTDIERALSFTAQTFSADDWERSYSVMDTRVSVTWQNTPLGAIAYLEALIFSCGYEEPDLNSYFSEANWQTIFANYESYEEVATCRNENGLRLYQFTAQNQGFEYAIHYWVKNDTNQRVIVMMLVFLRENYAQLGELAARLFPMLPNCS